MNKKKNLTILFIILIVIFGIVFCVNYFFHRSVKISTDNEITSISWHSAMSSKEHLEKFSIFNHNAGYGRFFYEFNLICQDKNIPIEISVFKENNHEHDNVEFEFSKGSSDSEIIINVNGRYSYSETININDEGISINLGP